MNETGSELRRSFLDFFEARGHRVVPSSSLVPVGDRTLLFTTAGMVQFKSFYGVADPDYARATSVQKCLRATDIDNVGHTIRHHTFLEMLGNFAFGDYFKAEAIAMAWEFVRQVVNLPAERIWISVHETDAEAAAIWERDTDIPPARIVRLGDEDNFWGPAGTTGACGPSSEMYWDLGADFDPSTPEGALTVGQRYIEFWNLVFPQFNQQASGKRQALAHPGIDTGMGLERLAMICQGARATFDTDLFSPIVARVAELAELAESPAGDRLVAVRVIADHARALTFAIADGVVPGNEGRGYVLRRLLRRASRRGRTLGTSGPFLHRLVDTVVGEFGDAYPELRQNHDAIRRTVHAEEERFGRTLDEGVRRLEDMIQQTKAREDQVLAGDVAFQLYDTYGFPIDLTTEIAAEAGISVDEVGFQAAMDAQRQRARAGGKFGDAGVESGDAGPAWVVVSEGGHSAFKGYEELTTESPVVRYRPLDTADRPRGEVVLAETPFYAESGGQVGDRGVLTNDGATFHVDDTVELDGAVVHRGSLANGTLEALAGAPVSARVDAVARAATQRNHTATHLLHAALKDELGEHVQQAGSLVAPDRLRFDFTHFEAMTQDQLRAIEERVNQAVLANTPVQERLESYDQARGRGAVALFGERYGREVRTIEVPGVSLELCGGTHVSGTGDIGLFKITSESAVGAGMRRLEAVTGLGSLAWTRQLETELGDLGALLGVNARSVSERMRAVLRELEAAKTSLSKAQSSDLDREVDEAIAAAHTARGSSYLVAEVHPASVDALRRAGDSLRNRLGSGAAVLGAVMNGKVNFLAVVTDDLIQNGVLRADDLVRTVAKVAGGSGGGKPHQALAGGKRVEALGEALQAGRHCLEQALSGRAETSAPEGEGSSKD